MQRFFINSILVLAAFYESVSPALAQSHYAQKLALIEDYIQEAAAKESLDPCLVSAVISVESNFNHRAISPVGARGLMQLMPGTADQLGFRKALNHQNPRANVLAGTKYLRNLINEFRGNVTLALAAYNAGPNAVKKYGKIPPFPETQSYVKKVWAEWKRLKR